ncbi:MAG: response regulator [Actinobacteria bacterium]|nr:response regulator [Actinomycetota bacterium]
MTDAQRLQQVLKNLLSNAFKFTERGGVTLTIEMADPALVPQRTAATPPAAADLPMLAFRVSDTGVGIAPDKVAAVFEAFQQADGTTSRKYGGTGLGLSISRAIVSMLGGALDVTSTPGVGSTFTLYLPFASGDEAPPTASELPASAAAATATGDDADGDAPLRRLLVVDSGDGVTKAIGGLLGPEKGVAVTVVDSPEGALATLTDEPWDCVVLALTMPRAAGLDLLDALRAHPGAQGTQLIAYSTRPLGARQRARVSHGVRLATTPAQLLGETAMVLHRRDGVATSLGPDADDGATSAALRGKKVLLVDDDVRNLFALASLLEDKGIEVVFGETGKEALAALERHPDTDLVLMDIMMPDMDGYETTRAIRAMTRFRELPIVALTAKAMEGDREKSLASGASDHVTKPVDPGRLLMVLKSWMA